MPDFQAKPKKSKTCCCCFPKQELEVHKSNNSSSSTVLVSSLPVSEPLPEDFGPGSCVNIKGTTRQDCSRFAVNLMCNRKANPNIAFHLNPRLLQQYIVRNCRIDDEWGEEETTSLVPLGLSRNSKFSIDIFTTTSEFLVSIDGRHVCSFAFRLPLAKVKSVEVQGMVDIDCIRFKKLAIYPEPSLLNSPFIVPSGIHQELPSQQLVMPVTGKLEKGFQQGWQLEIYGRVKILPHSFFINLQEGQHVWPHPTVPLHVNPRFNTTAGKHLFVRNAWIDGGWGQEERTPGCPFSPAAPFSLAVRKEHDRFSVWVDGQLAGEFKFRGGVDKIDTVYIQGDVTISSIFMKEEIDDLYFKKIKD